MLFKIQKLEKNYLSFGACLNTKKYFIKDEHK